MINSGDEFVIVDAKSDEDITRSILNQIIFEQETKQSDFHFPLDVQKQLIAMYNDAYGAMMPDFLRESIRLFSSERDKMGANFEKMVQENSRAVLKFNQDLATHNMDMFRKSFDMFSSMGKFGSTDEPAKQETAEMAASDEAFETLKSQIADLQNQLDSLKS